MEIEEAIKNLKELKQELNKIKRQNKIKDNYLKLMLDISYDYDGCNTVKSLQELIDELNDLMRKAIQNDDKSMMYITAFDYKKGIEKGKNILMEDIKNEKS